MRITNRILTSHLRDNLNRNLQELDALNSKLSSGKKYRLPSDYPAAATRAMKLSSDITETEQYIENVDEVTTWLSATDASLDEVTKALQRARELAVYGSNGTLSPANMQAIGREIDQLRDSIFQVANTRVGGRYIFAGSRTQTQPFIDDGSGGIQYQGDADDVNSEIGLGILVPRNIPGDAAFGDVFSVLQDLSDSLQAGDSERVSDLLSDLDAVTDNVLRYRSEVGARMNRLDLTRGRLEEFKINLTELVSKNSDIDVAKVIMELKMQENVYRMALASGARIIQPSLLDYMQ